MSQARYILELRAEGPGPEGIIRLRRLLKCALRAFGLRCVDVRELPDNHREQQAPIGAGRNDHGNWR